MSTTLVQIPTVSLEGWRNGNHMVDDRVKAIGDAVRNFGFVALVDHGVPVDRFPGFYEVLRSVFDLGPDVLKKYENVSNGRQTGYSPVGTETSKGHKRPNQMQFWQMRRPGNVIANVWPTDKIPNFEAEALWLFQLLDSVSFPIFEMLARYAGVDDDYFTKMIRGGDSLLRMIDYPEPKDENDLEDPGSGAHEDICLGTLLISSGQPGLEILTTEHGWLPVQNPPGSIVFNTGDMMQVHTNWHPLFPDSCTFPSTTHRVRRYAKTRRNSAPFFVHPRGNVEMLPGLTAHEMLMKRLRQIGMAS